MSNVNPLGPGGPLAPARPAFLNSLSYLHLLWLLTERPRQEPDCSSVVSQDEVATPRGAARHLGGRIHLVLRLPSHPGIDIDIDIGTGRVQGEEVEAAPREERHRRRKEGKPGHSLLGHPYVHASFKKKVCSLFSFLTFLPVFFGNYVVFPHRAARHLYENTA